MVSEWSSTPAEDGSGASRSGADGGGVESGGVEGGVTARPSRKKRKSSWGAVPVRELPPMQRVAPDL